MSSNEFNNNHKIDVLIFCENIRFLRKQNNLSQAEMAELLGIGIKSLRSLEKDRIPSRLSCDILFRIYTAFGVYPGDIFSPLENKN